MIRRLLLTIALILACPMAGLAQYATLIADRVRFDGVNTVVAEGNVEILYEGRRVLARRLTYDRAADRLTMDGPITLIDETGAVVTADSGALDGDLKAGIMTGARLVLDEQMQIAAVEINRVDGRYNQLYKAVASSCNVCIDRPVPLWQIRAKRVVHDQVERQLYFDEARFEVMGVPIAYLPQLRLPDPTLKRATGFLIPSIKSTSALGTGFRFPYFLTMGDHADLTISPFLSSKTRTLEARYRRALRWGDIELKGAVSRDDLRPNDTRAYLFGSGRFNLPRDFKLKFDVELVSDDAYLLTYDYSDKDRLSNGAEVTRTTRNEYISAKLEKLRTLRASEIPIEDSLATLLGTATYERRLFPSIGGEVRYAFDLQGYERQAETVSPALLAACALVSAPDCTARDVLRGGAQVGWRYDWQLVNGILAAVEGQLAADVYWIGQDTSFASEISHVTPTAAIELRWPFARTNARGATDVLEPVVQLAWTDTIGAKVPNEDSTLVEFDEGNLLSLSRFPGTDRYERGTRATLGLSWSHLAPGGRDYGLTVGRVIRVDDLAQFTAASGLDAGASDWLVAGRVQLTDRLTLSNRSLFDDQFDFAKSETRLIWTGRRFSAASSYIWVVAEPAEGRTRDVSEWNMDAAYAFNRNWTGKFDWRYDVTTNTTAEAGLGLQYRNECVNIDLSLSRRFTSSTTVRPTTDVGLQVSLNGFGNDGRAYSRSCQVKG
jgi:LPS-assembly protein